MLNFLLMLAGGVVLSGKDTTDTQRVVAGVLLAVGLQRTLENSEG